MSAHRGRTGSPRTRVYRLIRTGKLVGLRDSPRREMRVLESSLDSYFGQASQGAALARHTRGMDPHPDVAMCLVSTEACSGLFSRFVVTHDASVTVQ